MPDRPELLVVEEPLGVWTRIWNIGRGAESRGFDRPCSNLGKVMRAGWTTHCSFPRSWIR